MNKIEIVIIDTLQAEIERSNEKTKKLFYKQKQFMEINPYFNSLGRKKLINVKDKYGNDLWEIRLDKNRRIIFVERGKDKIIWLKICNHDELIRKNIIRTKDCY